MGRAHLHQAINPLELAMEAMAKVQSRFYADFPAHPEEQRYGFATSSTMKPTQWGCEPADSKLAQNKMSCSLVHLRRYELFVYVTFEFVIYLVKAVGDALLS